MTRFRLLALMAVLLSLGLVGPAHAVTTYTAQLSGANEANPVVTRARGVAVLQLSADGTELKYRLVASNIDDVTMAHIHVGAVGVNGPFVAWLHGPSADGGTQNGVLATGTITDEDLVGPLAGMTLEDLVALIESGDAYVNVHTVANPGGEIRGQVG
ncbi:CHRD domain-containing protein [Tessaracoccus oleiagri]|uniref:CHRD domain-containing protein n=2 Tax=Tessaracoccus oleiagri TaxID=686624 RepID=A0A1G9H8H7_9ACTN|nr:CHRD domain-containing protein [Tessaracoccus oleiagri]